MVGGFRDLETAGCLAIIGPSISDNGLIVAPLADAAELSCLNYTGGERTRGHYGFHYQVGSLEEEPVLLAQRLATRGLRRPAVVSDRSPVGRRYAEWFEASTVGAGLEIAGSATVSPVAEDLTPVIERLRGLEPDALVYLGLGISSRPVALALAAIDWDVPVVTNSALLFGYARPDWRDGWAGWEYVDVVADDNERRRRLAERSPKLAVGPMGCATLDMGRLLGEALARADHLTRHGIRDAFDAREAPSGDVRPRGHDAHLRLLRPRRLARRLPGAAHLGRRPQRPGRGLTGALRHTPVVCSEGHPGPGTPQITLV